MFMHKSKKSYIVPNDLELNILNYQKTNNKKYFNKVLFYVDKLIIRIIIQLRKQYPHFRDQELLELYNISILSLDKICKIYNGSSISNFFFRLKYQIRNDYLREFRYDTYKVPFSDKYINDVHIGIDDIDQYLLLSNVFNNRELSMLQDRFIYQLSYVEIANKYNIDKNRARYVIVKMLDKLKKYINNLNKNHIK